MKKKRLNYYETLSLLYPIIDKRNGEPSPMSECEKQKNKMLEDILASQGNPRPPR